MSILFEIPVKVRGRLSFEVEVESDPKAFIEDDTKISIFAVRLNPKRCVFF